MEPKQVVLKMIVVFTGFMEHLSDDLGHVISASYSPLAENLPNVSSNGRWQKLVLVPGAACLTITPMLLSRAFTLESLENRMCMPTEKRNIRQIIVNAGSFCIFYGTQRSCKL